MTDKTHSNSLPRTLGQALAFAQGRLDLIDAKVLLRKAAHITPVTLAAYPERELTESAAQQYVDWVERRVAGEPVAYLTGEREFYGRMFRVTPDTLIPRPDTELLVELALEKTQTHTSPHILDLGTGTGAIAVTLACERPQAEVFAVDLSAATLAVAIYNANELNAKVTMRQGCWFESVADEYFDVIVSNPPYIEEGDPHLSQGDLRFEPQGALASGNDGLTDIRQIITGAKNRLIPNGWLLLEHGYDQAGRVRALLREAGFEQVQSWHDLAGIERVSGGVFL